MSVLRSDTEAAGAPAAAHRFTVTACLEPSVLSRVVELFVLRDLIPHDVHCRAIDNESLRIDVAVRGLSPDKAEHLAARMRQFPTVHAVLLRA